MIDGQRVEGTTKGGLSRVVRIDAATVAALRAHRKQQAAERLAAGPGLYEDTGHVFTQDLGAPLYADTPTATFTKLQRRVPGLPHIRLHDLRHVHATTLLLAGKPVHLVAKRLGHKDPAMTLRVYAHALPTDDADLADAFADAVGE